MTTTDDPPVLGPGPIAVQSYPPDLTAKGSLLGRLLRTTDHKLIGRMYLVTAFGFFAIGGLMALLMRAELARDRKSVL